MKRWPTKPLGELVLATEQRDPRENPTDEFCYVDIAGVDNEAKTIVAAKRIVGADAPSRARKVIRKGDVIVSTVRPNLNAVALVPGAFDNQICSTGFSVLRPSENVLSGYLFAFARSPSFVDYLVAKTTGANYPAVNDCEVKDVPVPVPPLAEQERIVKLLDEADELRKLRAQADRRTAALIPALFHEMFGDPESNPKGWPVITLGELIAEGPQNGLYKPSTAYGEGIPILRIDAFYDGVVTVPWAELKRLQVSDEELARYRVHDNDIVVNRVNSGNYLGKSALIESVPEPTVFESNMMRFSFDAKRVGGAFLIHVLQTAHFRRHIESRAKRAIGQSSINQTDLKLLAFQLPPLALQKEFAARVTEIRAVQAEQAASRLRLENLFQSLLHRAFNGEL